MKYVDCDDPFYKDSMSDKHNDHLAARFSSTRDMFAKITMDRATDPFPVLEDNELFDQIRSMIFDHDAPQIADIEYIYSPIYPDNPVITIVTDPTGQPVGEYPTRGVLETDMWVGIEFQLKLRDMRNYYHYILNIRDMPLDYEATDVYP